MKNLVKTLQQGITFGLGIVLVVGISGIAYSALSSLTATTSETLTASKWNALVDHAVPSEFVGAFYLSSCPTGWSEANGTDHALDLRGTFIRGMNGDANSRDVTRALGDYQADDFKSHRHQGITRGNSASANSGYAMSAYTLSSATYTDYTGGTETRPKNVALLYCVKD